MAEDQLPEATAAQVASALPANVQQQDHAPAVSSPLNPDVNLKSRSTAAAPKQAPPPPPPREREQRERKESQKKRESTAAQSTTTTSSSSAAAAAAAPSTVPSKRKASSLATTAPSPMRYQIPEPRISDYDPPKPTVFASHEPIPFTTPDGLIELKKPADHAENKRGYRYTQCVADPYFPHKQFYRLTDGPPYGARLSFADTDKWIHYSPSGLHITNEKGWRMARANVCAREGSLYYEVKIIRGVPAASQPQPQSQTQSVDASGPQPHVRFGFARREAPLDAPVGFDGYSYGVTDLRFETMHRSRAGKFFHPKQPSTTKSGKGGRNAAAQVQYIDLQDSVREGDVVGLEIVLPALSLHQKVVSGIYNPAVDLGDGFDDDDDATTNTAKEQPYDVIRDRIPVPYKGNVYFETMDYVPTKAMESYADRTLNLSSLSTTNTATPVSTPHSILKTPPNPNHPDPSLRTLPHSALRIYKNGTLVGTAFDNLLAFLPPASAPSKSQGAREGFDDGMLGYFPAVACFSGGVAELNFGGGEDGFWFPPQGLGRTFPVRGAGAGAGAGAASTNGHADPDTLMTDAERPASEQRYNPSRTLRPLSERIPEQLAEDVVWDIIDEADFFCQDGAYTGERAGKRRVAGAAEGAGLRRGVASLREGGEE